MTATLTSFLPEVMPYCQNVPDFIAENAVRNAAIDFCQRSHWLLHQNPDITAVANLNTYVLSPPNDTTCIRVVEAWFNDSPLEAKSQEQLRDLYGRDWRVATGTPRYYTQLETCEIILVPMPDTTTAAALSVIAAIQPTRACQSLPEGLYERWLEVIAIGARGRLYETPGQPYSDKAAAGNAAARFRSGINEAKVERNKGLTRGNLSVRMPRAI